MWWIDDVILTTISQGGNQIFNLIKYLILLLVRGISVVIEIG